jgi:hypothetical protein
MDFQRARRVSCFLKPARAPGALSAISDSSVNSQYSEYRLHANATRDTQAGAREKEGRGGERERD